MDDLILNCDLCELQIIVPKDARGDVIKCPECRQEVEDGQT